MDIDSLARDCGCNPESGTTEKEMSRALSLAGLRWRHGDAKSLQGLDRELGQGRYVVLRTLIGSAKHWVCVDAGNSKKGYEIACPTEGRTTWDASTLFRRWAARDFDHFVVPGDHLAHRRAYRAVHAMEFGDFIRHAPVVPKGLEKSYELASIESASRVIDSARADPLHELPLPPSRWRFFRFSTNGFDAWTPYSLVSGSALLMAEAATGDIVGGIVSGVPLVRDAYRGQQAGVALCLAAHRDGPNRYLMPDSLSESGYRTRVRAHAVAIQEALDAGLPVSDAVVKSNPSLSPETGYKPRIRADTISGLDKEPAALEQGELFL